MKIILADDSDLILERLKEIISAFGRLEVIATVKNGTETLESLRTLKPDIAIVDINMPGLSGLEVLSEIRKENSKIIIIILTFYSSEYYRKLAGIAGADYFFNKADEFDKIPASIENIIRQANRNSKIEMVDLK